MNLLSSQCPVDADTSRNADVFNIPSDIDTAFAELVDDLLYFGSVDIGTTNYHVTELYQHGDTDEQARVIWLAFSNPDEAKQLAEDIITECATVYFKDDHPELTLEWYADKHGEY